MEEYDVGDIVVRKSYGGDVYFKIIQIIKKQDGQVSYILKGTNQRLIADAPLSDLEKPGLNRIGENDSEFNKRVNNAIKKAVLQRKNRPQNLRMAIQQKPLEHITFGRTGKVLHIDGDEEYMNVCLKNYKKLNVNAICKFVPEVNQPAAIIGLLEEHKPDILVLTGHDGMLKGSRDYKNIDSYKNSKYFVEAVKKAREYEKSYDELVIFAGACQSYYEALIEAGANFASSPSRILIHVLDPVFICEKIAYGSISKCLNPEEILMGTITGSKGVGGLETRGKYREGMPVSPYA